MLRRLGTRLSQRSVMVPLAAACVLITLVSVAAVFAAPLGPVATVMLALSTPFILTAWQLWHNHHQEKRKEKKAATPPPVVIHLQHLPEVPTSQALPDALRRRLQALSTTPMRRASHA